MTTNAELKGAILGKAAGELMRARIESMIERTGQPLDGEIIEAQAPHRRRQVDPMIYYVVPTAVQHGWSSFTYTWCSYVVYPAAAALEGVP